MKPKLNFINARLDGIKKSNLYRNLLDNKVSGPYIFMKGRKTCQLVIQ
ncbi:hypothetical protein DYY67_0704 [Candidatus Nitrosotalea sp. TS]|nr:hypothetical protein [Candidatus Nitrosotalea sp. TS]